MDNRGVAVLRERLLAVLDKAREPLTSEQLLARVRGSGLDRTGISSIKRYLVALHIEGVLERRRSWDVCRGFLYQPSGRAWPTSLDVSPSCNTVRELADAVRRAPKRKTYGFNGARHRHTNVTARITAPLEGGIGAQDTTARERLLLSWGVRKIVDYMPYMDDERRATARRVIGWRV